MKLSAATLQNLPKSVAVPAYARAEVTPGILHFGVGNFHRAHQAVYLDELFNSGSGLDWGIVGAGVLDAEKATRRKLAEQDWLTTVVEQDTGHMSARVTGAMVDFLMPADNQTIVSKLADPRIRIVSLTITEGGYFLDAATGRFDPEHPDVIADARSPEAPRTVFGLMLAGLKQRKAAGGKPFTVMCCDNIPHNGHVTMDAVCGLARLSDPGFAAWIEENVAFPNGMVDRITPATTDREREILKQDFGVDDNWPVFCEPFRQWVLEDRFTVGRPDLETVGVQFVADVAPFEQMKIRILNGGHAAIAYPAALMDIHFVHEAMQNELIRGFLAKLHLEEIMPTVPPVPGTDLEAYRQLIVRRFSNPKIGDTTRRLCLDGSNRQPKFIVPVIADRLKTGASIEGLALESALWCRYCFGTTDTDKEIEANDPNWSRLVENARAARADSAAWLAMDDIYGEVGRSPVFAAAFGRQLRALWQHGVKDVLARHLAA